MDPNSITRRDFLKSVGLAAAATTFGCATTQTPKQDMPSTLAETKPEPVIYPRLPGNKVQAPENGCLVGLRKPYAHLGTQRDKEIRQEQLARTSKYRNLDDLMQIDAGYREQISSHYATNIAQVLMEYKQLLLKKPAIYVLFDTPKLYSPFPETMAKSVAKEGVTPYISAQIQSSLSQIGMNLKDIAVGKHDKLIKTFAQGATRFGEEFGGFFISTMHEMNGQWYYWGQSSHFKDSWKRIVDNFETAGANKYATWVWHVWAADGSYRIAHHPDMYYPGDTYVDWIGLTAYSRLMDSRTSSMSFESLVGKPYEDMHKSHPSKPIMMAEFGKTAVWGQARWLKKAYESMKAMPGMKAAILWHHVSSGPMSPGVQGDDKTLNQKSLETLNQTFKDPYWIMAK